MVAENADRAVDELGCYQPSELLLGGRATDDETLREALRTRIPCCVENGEPSLFDYDQAAALLLQQFGQDVEALGLGEARPVVQAAGALLAYLKEKSEDGASPRAGAGNFPNPAGSSSWISPPGGT